ncbi:oxidoreductase [Hypoxylon trugodes]|uniref:oxidoreductase n=1 Tax=Hypoxylon trugodes TaxID=326681 RepID=UPI0021917F67|nr:oxidoreductase [Hypoxylon trugodes]KAI1388664.1 oxidoreductase [Hypoxylon trugodes]
MSSLSTLPHTTLLPLDVTSSDSLAAAVASVSAETGGTLDYLVNNSGQQVVAPILDADLGEARAMYDVNVFGVVATVQAFAPLLLAAKGTVVNICSITGLLYPPYMGLYGSTKSALTTISEALRLELHPLGIKVATIITGAVRTNLAANSPPHILPPNSVYTPAAKEIAARATGADVTDRVGSKEDFGRDLVSKVLRGATGRVYVGNLSTAVRIASSWFPACLIDYMQAANTGLDRLSPA